MNRQFLRGILAVVVLATTIVVVGPQQPAFATMGYVTRTNGVSGAVHGAGPYTPSGTFTPVAGKVLVATVIAESNGEPTAMATDGSDLTISGGSLTWVPVVGRMRGPLYDIGFRAFYAVVPASPPSNMQVTVDAGSFTMYQFMVNVKEYSDVDTTSPVAGAVASDRGSNPNDTFTATLTATPTTSDLKVGIAVIDDDDGLNPLKTPTGWTQVAGFGVSPASQVLTQTISASTTLNFALNSNVEITSANTTYGGFILKYLPPSEQADVSVTVDPSFLFSVNGRSSVCNGQSSTNFQTTATSTAVSLGHLTSATVGGGAQDLTVASNAGSGFVVYLKTTGTTPHSLRSSSGSSIADVSGTNASPGAAPTAGTAAFGYTSSDASTPFTSNTWAKLTNSGEPVVVGSAGTSSKSECIGYQVAVASTTPAGTYASTIVYTAVPTF